MQDKPDLDPRGGLPDDTVNRLASEIAALKLELATLHSALRELQFQQTGLRAPGKPAKVEPPVRPTPAPAAIVVLVAAGLLTWQLITTPRAERGPAARSTNAEETQMHPAQQAHSSPRITIDTPLPTEPPVTPLVTPTIYRGTLSVNADRPGATVFVNRRNVGKAPVRVRNLRAGAHLIWVESEGYRRWTRVVTVPAERVTRVSADLEPIIENP